MRKTVLSCLLAAAAGAGLALLVTAPPGALSVPIAKADVGPDAYSQLGLFGQVFERVRANYAEKPDDAKLIENAINGMVSSLDPHSHYMNEQAWKDMQETTQGEFGGLGIEVMMENGLVKVVAPMDDTPAATAGIMSGDLITQIDGVAVQGLTLEQAVSKMKGPIDTKTRLKIARKGVDQLIEVTIVREIIRVRPVTYHTDGADVGYIRITSFNEQTTDALRKAIGDISKQIPPDKLVGYVVDLRNNPGGLLDQAVSVSSTFMARGEVVSTRGRTPEETRRFAARGGDRTGGKPVVVIGIGIGDRGRRVARPPARDPDRHPLVRQGLGPDDHSPRQRQRVPGVDDRPLFYAIRPLHPGAGRQPRYRSGAGCARGIEGPPRIEGRGIDARPSVRRRNGADRFAILRSA